MEKTDLLQYNKEELTELIISYGEKAFRAKQIYEWLHKKLVSDFSEMTNISKSLKEKLAESHIIYPMIIKDKLISKKDGTVKYLMETSSGSIIESVAMQYSYGMSVCISSQAGCRMGCSFCASTILGLEKSLSASEMLAQIYLIQKDMGRRVDNIVVMGIGEPFDNYDQLIRFLHMITDEDGVNISQRSITVSTCGLVDKIYDFANEHMQVTLAVSLHAPNDDIRKSIMPVANRYSMDEIKKACRYFIEKTGRRVTFEYAMIDGVNDSKECAKELVSYTKDLLCHINLIPVNAVKERKYRRAGAEAIRDFEKYLEKNRINVTIRKGMGSDIDAACGQLRRQYATHTGRYS